MNEQLVELVQSLAVLREQEKVAFEAKIAKDAAFFEDPAYIGIVQILKEARDQVVLFTEMIHEVALADYAENKDKHPHVAVEIKIFTEAEIIDMVVAREWCFDNLRPALKVDGKVLGKYAKEFGDVPGVEVKETPKVQIASNLNV